MSVEWKELPSVLNRFLTHIGGSTDDYPTQKARAVQGDTDRLLLRGPP